MVLSGHRHTRTFHASYFFLLELEANDIII